jgi:hypothetical protein
MLIIHFILKLSTHIVNLFILNYFILLSNFEPWEEYIKQKF